MSEIRNTQEPGGKPTGPLRAKLLTLLGGTLIVASVVVFLAAFVALQIARVENPGTLWKIAGTGIPLWFLAMIGGVTCYKLRKQLGAASAQAILAQDIRPPIVYLRSFQDDSVAAKGSDYPGGGALWAFVSSISTEEEQLAEAIKDIGPFVAVGKPGEKLPELGAAQMYLTDAEWRDKVQELMSRSKLVILRAGKTDGLWWEVEAAAKIVNPENMLFLLPYDEKQYQAFRMQPTH